MERADDQAWLAERIVSPTDGPPPPPRVDPAGNRVRARRDRGGRCVRRPIRHLRRDRGHLDQPHRRRAAEPRRGVHVRGRRASGHDPRLPRLRALRPGAQRGRREGEALARKPAAAAARVPGPGPLLGMLEEGDARVTRSSRRSSSTSTRPRSPTTPGSTRPRSARPASSQAPSRATTRRSSRPSTSIPMRARRESPPSSSPAARTPSAARPTPTSSLSATRRATR